MKLKKFSGKTGMNRLSILPFNRHYTLRGDLVNSMKKNGFIVPLILCYSSAIDGVKRLYILDGQHKAMAASYLDMDFYGMLLPQEPKTKKELVELVSTLNATQKNWNIVNYIDAYSSLNYPDYNELLKIQKQHQYSHLGLASMLGGTYAKSTGGNTPISNQIMNGLFKIRNKPEAMKSIVAVQSLHEMNTRMLLAFHSVRTTNPKFNFGIFKKRFQEDYLKLKTGGFNSFKEEFESYF